MCESHQQLLPSFLANDYKLPVLQLVLLTLINLKERLKGAAERTLGMKTVSFKEAAEPKTERDFGRWGRGSQWVLKASQEHEEETVKSSLKGLI